MIGLLIAAVLAAGSIHAEPSKAPAPAAAEPMIKLRGKEKRQCSAKISHEARAKRTAAATGYEKREAAEKEANEFQERHNKRHKALGIAPTLKYGVEERQVHGITRYIVVRERIKKCPAQQK